MERPDSSTLNSASRSHLYDEDIIRQVWGSAMTIHGNDPALWRKDEFGAWIHRLEYGNRNSQFGWEILDPAPWRRGLGLCMLRACQWQNHLDYVTTERHTMMTAEGLQNVQKLL